MSLSFGWRRNAGLVCAYAGGVSLHLFVRPSDWVWLYEYDWHDGPLHAVGLGPLFLLCWMDGR